MGPPSRRVISLATWAPAGAKPGSAREPTLYTDVLGALAQLGERRLCKPESTGKPMVPP